MNLRRLSARTAAVGVATALAAGAVVSVGTTSANAAGGAGTYSCTSSFPAMPVTVTMAADVPPIVLATGFPAPAGTLHFAFKFTIPEAAVTGMRMGGINQVGTSNVKFALPFGDTAIPVEGLNLPKTATPATGDFDLAVPDPGASQGAFRFPSPGKDLAVKLPTTFTMTATTDSVAFPTIDLACTLQGASPTLATLTVTKQAALLTAKAPKSAKAGKKITIAAVVKGDNVPATGKVVAKEGKKVLGKGTLKKGKASIVLKKGIKKVGKHTIVLSYAGDKKTNKSNVFSVAVKVKKK